MWLLTEVEHVGFHYRSGYFQNAVAAVSSGRRIVVLLIGSAIVRCRVLIRHYLKHEKSTLMTQFGTATANFPFAAVSSRRSSQRS